MRQKSAQLLKPIILLLISVYASLPLLKGIPDGFDSLFHLFRAVQLDALIENGIFFSRWAPDMVYQYGYPLFNYYPPLAYYGVELLHLLGLSLETAFVAFLGLIFLFASTAMYLWVSDIFDEKSALLAALMYTLAPYMMLNAIHRGALAEHVGLALMPFILWAARRFLISNHWPYALTSTLAYTALLLSHTISAFIFTPVFLGYLLIMTYPFFPKERTNVLALIQILMKPIGLWLLGLGLSAFYWLPALLERDLVQITQVFQPGVFNYRSNFLTLGELFTPPITNDPNLVNQWIPTTLNLVALLGVLVVLSQWRRFLSVKEQFVHLIFAAFVTLSCILMVLPLSEVIWANIPLLYFLQFPWRFLGMASLFVAALAGVGFSTLSTLLASKRLALVLNLAVIVTIALYILPWQYPDYITPFADALDVTDSIQYEVDSGLLGTTATGEYLPIGVKQLPAREQIIVQNNHERLATASIPTEAKIITADYTPLEYKLTINTSEAFVAEFNTFFFEGWQAEIDKAAVPIEVAEPEGTIGVVVPPGQHDLRLYFATTPIRQAANFISLLTIPLLVGFLLMVGQKRSWLQLSKPIIVDSKFYGSMTLILMGVILFKVIVVDHYETPFRSTRFDGQNVRDVQNSMRANFGGEMYLLGFNMMSTVQAGETAVVTLYWQANSTSQHDYSVSTVLVDQNNNVISQNDNQRPGELPTTTWLENEYAQDRHELSIPATIPPGLYQLQINVYQYGQPEQRLNLLDDNGNPIGQTLETYPITITRPDEPHLAHDQIDAAVTLNAPLTRELSLLGYTLPDYKVQVGQQIPLIFYVAATTTPNEDFATRLIFYDDQKQVLSREFVLIPDFPTSMWQEGDIWRATPEFLVPATLTSGLYNVALQVEENAAINLGPLEIVSPEHLMTLPPITFIQEEALGQIGKLIGFTAPAQGQAGEVVSITLLWQSLGETDTSYKSFVQLLDQEGRFIVGSDTIPANWQRPTTSWITNEYILDPHTLQIPAGLAAGEYYFIIGLYDSESGQRLSVDTGRDHIILANDFEIVEN